MFYKAELVTQEKNFCKNFQASCSKCDVILRNSISQFDFVTQDYNSWVTQSGSKRPWIQVEYSHNPSSLIEH